MEAHELQVLQGARETLRSSQPDIVFETGNQNTPEVIQLLLDLGYGFFAVINGKLTKIDENIALNVLNVLASHRML